MVARARFTSPAQVCSTSTTTAPGASQCTRTVGVAVAPRMVAEPDSMDHA
ncbi:MAG: hypothetical protein IPF99_20820 [Deltaproteobacteria bacterium]|nr:hypothetical protein [Deltaproteobacteria bacterium]